MGNAAKEIVFGILFLVVVVLIIGILFYEFIPSQMIPEASVYNQTNATTKLLQTINEEVQQEESDDEKEVLKSYNITSDDLAIYSNQQDFVKGKNHPFFDYTSIDAGETLQESQDLKSAVGDALTSSSSRSSSLSQDTSSSSSSNSSSQTSANNSQYNSSSSSTSSSSTTSSNTIINPNIDTRSLRDVSNETDKSTK